MTDMITAEEAGKLLDDTTPGPWTWGKEDWTPEWFLQPGVLILDSDGGGPSGVDEFDAANARLIAAAPDLARTVIALHAQLADAKAAQAMVVERAAEAAYNWLTTKDPATQEARYQAAIDYFEADIDRPAEQVREVIRALAPADGLALVQALRAERDGAIRGRDGWRDDYKALSAAIVGDTGLSAMTVATQARLFRPRAEAAEAHVAALTARVEGLTGAITFALSEYDAPNDIDEAMSKLRAELSKDAALSATELPK